MPPEPPKKEDALTILARASLLRRRRRSTAAGLVLLAVIVALLGLFVWWTWPAPDPGELWLTAYDVLANPEEDITLRAQLGPQKAPVPGAKLSGFAVWFLEPESGLREESATGGDGMAAMPMKAPPAQTLVREFRARYPGDERRRGLEATGRIHVWPRDSAVLVIDADHALAATTGGRDTDPANRVLLPGAAETLRRLRATYRIVYVTASGRTPVTYYRLAAWLKQSGPTGTPLLPDGPLLGPPSLPGEEGDFWTRVGDEMKSRFDGKLTVVVADDGEERAFARVGFSVLRLDRSSWAEIGERLR